MTNLVATISLVLTTNWTTFEKVVPNPEPVSRVCIERQRATLLRSTIGHIQFEGQDHSIVLKVEEIPNTLPIREVEGVFNPPQIYFQNPAWKNWTNVSTQVGL
jgi:hypothetical protein